MKMNVIDFSGRIGTMVHRSRHFQREYYKNGKPQVGIITGCEYFADSVGNPICWPIVMWEGCRTMPSMTHPVLVDLYHKKDKMGAKRRKMVE